MNARRVSREPYRVRRDRREVVVAVAVALLIVLGTAAAVWILAPADESEAPTFTPTLTSPASQPSETTTPAVTEPPATSATGG